LNVAVIYSAITLLAFVAKTVWVPSSLILQNVHLLLIVIAYLGFEHTLGRGSVPTLLSGALYSTFSGGAGAVYIIEFGVVFLICYLLQRKTNFVLITYQTLAVFLLTLLTGALLAAQSALHFPAFVMPWRRLIYSALWTAALSPLFFLFFRKLDSMIERMSRRFVAREEA